MNSPRDLERISCMCLKCFIRCRDLTNVVIYQTL